MRVIDRISHTLGVVAAALLFLTGVFLTYEVAARYIFRAPTTWASELSELFLLWGVFLALGRTVRYCENISIDVFYGMLRPAGRRVLDVLVLAFVLFFFVFVAKYGFDLAADSLQKGRTTGTMVDIPMWWVQAAVPLGSAWAAVQTLAELIRAIGGRPWSPPSAHGAEP